MCENNKMMSKTNPKQAKLSTPVEADQFLGGD